MNHPSTEVPTRTVAAIGDGVRAVREGDRGHRDSDAHSIGHSSTAKQRNAIRRPRTASA